jgi:hypothetical protein
VISKQAANGNDFLDLRWIYVAIINTLHCKKRLAIFLRPAGVSLTKQLSLTGNNYGKIANLFLQCMFDFSQFSFMLEFV